MNHYDLRVPPCSAKDSTHSPHLKTHPSWVFNAAVSAEAGNPAESEYLSGHPHLRARTSFTISRYLASVIAVLAVMTSTPAMAVDATHEGREPVANISSVTQEERIEATELRFEESEPGIEPYGSRQLVSAGYLRMDDGRDDGDYILYDRKKRRIHSVTHHDRSILLIRHRDIEIEPPSPLALSLSKSLDPQAPPVSGLPPEHIVFSVNGKECHHVIAVTGLLREVNLAMREYLLTLAGEQAENITKTPPEQQSPCMLANMIFAPTRHLEYGFPILEWDYRGKRRTLIGYRESVQAESKLFRLPEGYRVFSINEPQTE